MDGLYVDAFIAACMAIDAAFSQHLVSEKILLKELVGDAETVDKGRQATLSIGVRKQVECLEALVEMWSVFGGCACGTQDTHDGIGEIGCVGMRLKGFACVGGILR